MPVVGVEAGWPLRGRAKTPVVGVGSGWLLGWAWEKMPVVGGVEAGWPPLERAKMPVVGVVEAGWPPLELANKLLPVGWLLVLPNELLLVGADWLLERAKMPVVGVEAGWPLRERAKTPVG